MDQEVQQILTGMKARLSEGWIQGAMRSDDGKNVCLYGALVSVVNLPIYNSGSGEVKGRKNQPGQHGAYYVDKDGPAFKAIDLIATEVGVEWENLALWQDSPERTLDDIIGAIDQILLKADTGIETPEEELVAS